MKLKNISNKVKHIKLKNEWVSIDPKDILETDLVVKDKEMVLVEEKQKQDKTVKEIKLILEQKKNDNLFKRTIKIPIKTVQELKKMTKDEINDYSAKLGFGSEIKNSMKKADMIKTLMRLKDEENI